MAAFQSTSRVFWSLALSGLVLAAMGTLTIGLYGAVYGGHSVSQMRAAVHGSGDRNAPIEGGEPSASERALTGLAIETRASSVPTDSNWGEQLRESRYFDKIKKQPSANWNSPDRTPRSGLTKAEPEWTPPARRAPLSGGESQTRTTRETRDQDDGETYRTMCVRTCDGFFWPVSFATTQDNFEKDAATCANSCGGPSAAKLYVYKNPGAVIEDMEDTDGKPYKRLPTAFQFRTSFDASCKCRAHPWEEASRNVHQSYALADRAAAGDKAAAKELKALKQKMEAQAKVAGTNSGARDGKVAKNIGFGSVAMAAQAPDGAGIIAGTVDDRARMTRVNRRAQTSVARSGRHWRVVTSAGPFETPTPVSQMSMAPVQALRAAQAPTLSVAPTDVVRIRYGSGPVVVVPVAASGQMQRGAALEAVPAVEARQTVQR